MTALQVYLGVGVLFIALGLPLARGKVKPNQWYGFRTPAALGDERVWYPTNAAARGRSEDLMRARFVPAICLVLLAANATGQPVARIPVDETPPREDAVHLMSRWAIDTGEGSGLVIGRIRWRPDGRLWVEPLGVVPRDGTIACFDELDPDGKLLRRIHLEVPEPAPGDRLLLLEDGRFVLLRGYGPVDDTDRPGEGANPRILLLEES